MPDDIAIGVREFWERQDGERGTWKTHWQECSDYMDPNRADYLVRLWPGQKRMRYVFDATPLLALDQYASGIQAMIVSPTLPWIRAVNEDESIAERDDVRTWYGAVSNWMLRQFNGAGSNFQSQAYQLLRDFGLVGTGVMSVLGMPDGTPFFGTRHLRECVIGENEREEVDTLCRRWRWPAKPAWQRWGRAAGPSVAKAMREGRPEQPFHFLHLVRPRNGVIGRESFRKPWQSLVTAEEDCVVIEESGFDEFPFMVPRLAKVTGELYGRGLGMTALPDVKMLNAMMRTVLKAAQKVVDPPLQAPDNGISAIKTFPGAMNFYRSGSRDRIEPIATGGRPDIGMDLLNGLRATIRSTFFNDLIRTPVSDPNDPMNAGKGVTATFTVQMRDEGMRVLSAINARLKEELLDPLNWRVFMMGWRKSVALGFQRGSPFPPPPDVLRGHRPRWEYLSPIEIAQHASQNEAIGRVIQTAGELQQIDPEADTVSTLDADAILRLTARNLNAPAGILRPRRQVLAERAQRQQQATDQANSQTLGNLAGAAQQGAGAVGNIVQTLAQTQPGAPG